MAPDVASALARLGRREHWVGEDDLVFVGEAGHLPRRVRVAPPLQGSVGSRVAAAASLPRSAPHVRHADDRQGRHPPGAGVDGSRGHSDDDALPALRARAPRTPRWSRRRFGWLARIRAIWAGRPQDVRRCPKMSVRSVGRIACDGGGFEGPARRVGGNRGVLQDVCQHF